MKNNYLKTTKKQKKANLIFRFLAIGLLFLLSSAAFAQSTIKGKVTDEKGETLIGVSVNVVGTSNGVATDMDGYYTLKATAGQKVQFVYVGYQTQEITVGTQKTYNVVLKENNKVLDEVVVVGFGVQKKVNVTGSIGTATAKDIESRPVQNAVLALQGVIPGLNISNNTTYGGELDRDKVINVRGTGTLGNLGSSDSPLILIDGIQGDLVNLNPQDIESISVLKDASSSAVYGARAPYGVILVTTKSGKSGHTQINYNFNYRVSSPIKLPEMMDSWEFVNFFRDAYLNGGTSNTFNNSSYLQKVKDYHDGLLDKTDVVWSSDGTGNTSSGKWNYDYTNANVDWLHEYYKDNSPSSEHDLSVSGGNGDMHYYTSVNYMTQDGFMRYGTDTYDRYAFAGKFGAKISKIANLDYSTRWIRTDYARPTVMNSSFYNNLMRRARPVRAIYDPNGYLMSDINYVMSLQDGGREKDQKDTWTQQFKLTLEPIKNLKINAEMNIRTNNNTAHYDVVPSYSHYSGLGTQSSDETYISGNTSVSTTSYVYEGLTKYTYLNPTLFATYMKSVKLNNFQVTAGYQYEEEKYKYFNAQQDGMISTDQPVLDLTTGINDYSGESVNASVGGGTNKWRTMGFFGRFNYNYDERYLLEVSMRYDGSSRFQSGHQWVYSPSFSAGWNITKERFMKPTENYLDNLKLRVSYGQLANQNNSYYHPTDETISTSTNSGYWLVDGAQPNTASLPSIVSSSLTWEKVRTLNMGLDWGVLRNRLTGSFDYYIRNTVDMVGPASDLPDILGASSPYTNNTSLRTNGWELSVSWRDKIKDFTYGARLGLSDSYTTITKYYNSTSSLSSYIAGQRTGNIWGYTTIGIAKTNEEMTEHLAEASQTAIGSSWAAGDIMYKDTDGSGAVSNGSNTLSDHGDLKIIGNTTARYRIGVNFDAAWKGFDFSMFWQGVLKKDYSPGTYNMMFWGTNADGEYWSTALKQHKNYFRSAEALSNSAYASNYDDNLNAYYPRPLFSSKNQQDQTRYLQDASYVRLKNMQIGYRLPKKWLSVVKVTSCRIFASGENLLTLTKLTDIIDPETAGNGKQGGALYPLSKTYSFGLSLNF